MGRVTRAEWRWAAFFAAAVMALTCLPYLVAGLSQTSAWQFGGFLFAVEDANSYIAKMNLGAHGAWLFTLRYSSEPQRGALLLTFYLLLGKLAGPTHAAQVLWYHGARVVFGGAMLLASYAFLAELLPRVAQRRLGMALVALGGGLGWLLAALGAGSVFGSLPVDFISPEAFSFLILFGFPHLALARALLLLGMLAFLRGRSGAAGLWLLALGLVQPLSVALAWLLVGLVVLRRPQQWKGALITVSLSAPVLLYSAWSFSADPVLAQWLKQNVLASPHPLHYVLAYGILALPAVFGWRVLARRRPELAWLVGGWLLLLPVLLYLPIGPQRRLIEGAQLPLVALAVLGLTVAWRRQRRWLSPAFTALALLTTALVFAENLINARNPAVPVFHPADQVAAFEWLNRNGQADQVVLSTFVTGNSIPVYTPLVAYIGHGPETVFLDQKSERVSEFYDAAGEDQARQALLTDGRISYVIFGPAERALGDFDPAEADYLQRIYSNDTYAIYGVAP